MREKLTSVVAVVALALAIVGLLAHRAAPQGDSLAGTLQSNAQYFLGGLRAGTSAQFSVDKNGNVSTTASTTVLGLTVSQLTLGTGGTSSTFSKCVSASWNPGALGTSTASVAATSTTFGTPSSTVGDTCSASLSSATSSFLDVGCNIPANNSGTVTVYNNSSSALDPATGTAKICFSH